MLPTLVIGLREGLEAALIVGIIAAFLRKQGRTDLLRWVFVGVSVAIVLCVAVGVVLDLISRDLPQKQQEGLETVIGALAVGMVTYMVVWMRRHSRELKGTLEAAAADAMAGGSAKAGRAMVVMAFLAVLREGFETVVFLLAAFNENANSTAAGAGAVIGIAIAVVLGLGIYRGGVRLNLSKFFRATGLVLVLVAGGLVVTAFHTAHEAGWLNTGQGATIDLTWLVRPGSVLASLLTGMLGVQPHPVVIEVIGWLAYVIPIGLYVAWPPGRGLSRQRSIALAGLVAAAAGIAAVVVAVTAPARPEVRPATSGGGLTAQVARANTSVVLSGNVVGEYRVHPTGSMMRDGVTLATYDGSREQPVTAGRSALAAGAIAKLNGGRLPLGLVAGSQRTFPVSYSSTTKVTIELEPTTSRIVSAAVTKEVVASVQSANGDIPLADPVRRTHQALPATTTAVALVAARHALAAKDQRSDHTTIAIALGVLAAALLAAAGGGTISGRRRRTPVDTPANPLVGHQVSLT